MKVLKTRIDGLLLIENFTHHDDRGSFIKTLNYDILKSAGADDLDFKEIYFSISKNNTLRGMHFQRPPTDHAKFIYLTAGKVVDVILDLRKNSKTFGSYADFDLVAYKNSLYIPRGCAHGFKALELNTVMVYNQTSVYNNELDSGIHYDSFGYNWQIDEPIISERDKNLISFSQFKSPF